MRKPCGWTNLFDGRKMLLAYCGLLYANLPRNVDRIWKHVELVG